MLRAPQPIQAESHRPSTGDVASRMVSVHEDAELRHPSQLKHLWHSLWSHTPRASFRQTPEFLEASLADWSSEATFDSALASGRWRFLIVSAWQRPIGIVPLREHTVSRAIGSNRVLSMADSPWGKCPGPIGPHPATTLTAAVRYLVEHDDSWDKLELPEVVLKDIEPIRKPLNWNLNRSVSARSHRELLGLELPSTFGQFWADRTAAARHRWRDLEAQRSRRRNEQFVRFRPGGSLHGDTDRDWELIEQLQSIVHMQDGTPHAARSRELFERLRDLHAEAVDAASADIAVWFHDSRPAAFAYNFHCRDRVETALLMADPSVPQATDRLIGLMLRDEIARGDSWHLFLPNSTQGTIVNRQFWLPTELHENTVTHDRCTTIGSRLQRWFKNNQPATSVSYC